MSAPACVDCAFAEKHGFLGLGCSRFAVLERDIVTGHQSYSMPSCVEERNDEGSWLARLFCPERLPCGPGGRYFQAKQ